jgi:hypothetical protein
MTYNTYIDNLDFVLNYLNKTDNDIQSPETISKKCNLELFETHRILEQLLIDDYIAYSVGKTGGLDNGSRYYYITYKGKLALSDNHFDLSKSLRLPSFLNSLLSINQPYKANIRSKKQKSIITISKVIMAIANASIILWFSYQQFISNSNIREQNLELENKIMNLEKNIDSLNIQYQLNSIKINDSTTNK